MVKKAGTAISNLVQSMYWTFDSIKIPTIIRAEAVTADVITVKIGEKKAAMANKRATKTEDNPVRAPTATPEVDST